MNEIFNKFILAGDKFRPELHLKQPGFTCSAKQEIQTIKKQEIQTILAKMNLIRLVFNMIWFMEISKI